MKANFVNGPLDGTVKDLEGEPSTFEVFRMKPPRRPHHGGDAIEREVGIYDRSEKFLTGSPLAVFIWRGWK